jgi:hypothetical protein
VVCIGTRLRAGRSGVRIRVGARDFSRLYNVQTGSRGYPACYSMGIGFEAAGA